MAIPIPLREVRLVAPITDAESGTTQDAIIEAMTVKSARWVNGVKIPRQRFVSTPGGRLEIPYPPEEEGDKPEYDLDTLRIEVEERSWTPTLSVPPMPPSIIDELRNKYSKFRTHHDDEWVMAKDAELERKQLRLQGMRQRMIAPLEERRRVKDAERLKTGEPTLDDEVLARIGRLMATNLKLEGTVLAEEMRPEKETEET
jgi:large subunit ribosomal protein L24